MVRPRRAARPCCQTDWVVMQALYDFLIENVNCDQLSIGLLFHVPVLVDFLHTMGAGGEEGENFHWSASLRQRLETCARLSEDAIVEDLIESAMHMDWAMDGVGEVSGPWHECDQGDDSVAVVDYEWITEYEGWRRNSRDREANKV